MTSETEKNITVFSYRAGKHRLKSIRRMLFFIAAAQTAVTAAAAFISSFISFEPPVYLQMLVIELLAYLLPISMYAKENRLLSGSAARKRFGLRGCAVWQLVVAVIIGYGCQFAMVLLDLPITLAISADGGYIPHSAVELAAAIVTVAVIPAVFEEFLLRGIVYGVMAEFNTTAAAVFTTIMFALLHGNLSGIPGYLLLGIVLIFVLRRTGSLYACMLLHMANNVTAVLLSYFSSVLIDIPSATIKLFVTGIIVGFAAVCALAFLTKPAARIKRLKAAELLGQSFINLPIILCIAMIVGLLYLQIY